MLQHTFAKYETSNYLKCIASTCLSPPCVLFAYETRVSMIQFVCYVKGETTTVRCAQENQNLQQNLVELSLRRCD